MHTECLERWVRHKIDNSQRITCPLCRYSLGDMPMEDIRRATQNFKNQMLQDKIEESKKNIQEKHKTRAALAS